MRLGLGLVDADPQDEDIEIVGDATGEVSRSHLPDLHTHLAQRQ